MATYIANNAARDTVTITLSKAEAEALLEAASRAQLPNQNGKTKAAFNRAISALNASTNTSARRAGFFD